jgi:outer membrane protein assembly factor BamB
MSFCLKEQDMVGKVFSGRAIAAVSVVLMLCAGIVCAGDWPQWHGPNRDGVTPEVSGWTGSSWGITESWRSGVNNVTNTGYGVSAPVIVKRSGDAVPKIYIMGWRSGKDYLYCLNAETGLVLWDESYTCPDYGRTANYNKHFYKGVTATPAMDLSNGYLYTLSCDGDVCCWDTTKSSDRLVWSFNLHTRYGNVPASTSEDYGFVASPLLYGDWVIIEVGDESGNLMAFDKSTGAEAWTSANTDKRGWGSPVMVTVEGAPCVAAMTRSKMLVVRADPGHLGETLVEYNWNATYSGNIPSPVVSGNRVFFSRADGSGCRAAAVDVTLSGYTGVFDQSGWWWGCSTAAIHEDHLYLPHVRKVRCRQLDGSHVWASGDVLEDPNHSNFDGASVVVCAGDDKLIVWSGRDRGDLRLIEATPSPASYRELALVTNVLQRKEEAHYCGYTHVIMGHGRIVCSSIDGDVVCYSVDQQDEGTVRITEDTDEGLACYKIETPSATYYYDKAGGGFTSMLDTNDIDWINYHPTGNQAGNYRGIPNSGAFHPGDPGGISTTDDPLDTPLAKVTVETTRNGWGCTWEFFPKYARMNLHTQPLPTDKYWFLYEGTPGGQVGSDDVWWRSDGTSSTCWDVPDWDETDMANSSDAAFGSEWVFFADGTLDRSLFLAHEDDQVIDDYWLMYDETGMTVFRFGGGTGVDPRMTEIPATLVIGFVESREYNTVKSAIDRAWFGGGQASDADSDGMPDAWENEFLGGTDEPDGGPYDDMDGDGYCNFYEYVAGTDPDNGSSLFEVDIEWSNGQVVVSYPRIDASGAGYETVDQYYTLERVSDLFGSWESVAGHIDVPGDNGVGVYAGGAADDAVYYRARVKLQ